ncbi:MAG: DNA polymerase I [Deltaproteobacteria bacterium RBG_13_49_15]|nr:MAG: DNA polymerase I [Deltaproteobacteria bacterium RBG_13_49_15]
MEKESKTKKTLYLIDGSAYIHRAYHAIRTLSNSRGLPTNAVFGFTRMIIKLVEDKKPSYIVVLFDAKGPTFRHRLYDDYKANRPPLPEELIVQIPYIKKITEAFNFKIIEMPGYEADDLIGTLARQAEESGFDVIMVTGDKDFMQLVSEKSTIWDPMKEKSTNIGVILNEFGIPPEQLVDVMGLAGDASDNIPGVPGIGQKTAVSLIKRFRSLETLYEHIQEVSQARQRENLIRYKEQAFLSKKLATIDTQAPISFNPEQFQLQHPDRQQLARLFKALEFRQLQQVFPESSDLSQKRYLPIQDLSALSALISKLKEAGLFSLDTETTSQDPMLAQLVGMSFSVAPNEAFYIPLGHSALSSDKQLNIELVLNRLKPILEDSKIRKIGQNIKYDWIVLNRYGIDLAGVIFDTMLASYLIDPTKRAHNLDQIALDFLDHKKISYQDITVKGKRSFPFSEVLLEDATRYACEDADITLMAYQTLNPKLREMGLFDLFETVEMPLVSVLKRMEMAGICVDRERLALLSKSFEYQLEVIESQIYSVAGQEFNIHSSQQLGQILFEKLGLPVQKKTKKKTAFSTDMEVLTSLAPRHELPALVLRHRTLAKLKSTYVDALLEMIHPETGRIHTSFNQTITATGRLSSSEPNLQNIPIRTDEGREIRSAFISRSGWHLLSADYSQIELRILAHYSDDAILIDAFINGEDIHARTAAEVFQMFPSMVTPELRRQAKVINFGIIYGMSPFGLSRELGISRKMAQTYIEHYFSRYKGVKQFIEQTIDEARKTGRVNTLLGRIRFLPDITSANASVRQFAERAAINTPIQGTAADLIKMSMIKTDAALIENGLKSAMLLSVHDELVLEVPPDELETTRNMVKQVMEGIWELKVPLKVNLSVGHNWAEAH